MCKIITIKEAIEEMIIEQTNIVDNDVKSGLPTKNEMVLMDLKSHLIRCNLKAKEEV